MNIDELTIAFKKHEAQCEERWKTIFNRMNRIEAILLGATGAVLLLLLTLVVRLFLMQMLKVLETVFY